VPENAVGTGATCKSIIFKIRAFFSVDTPMALLNAIGC
tara:strand:+ start:118 stop:231 length:114 start_codon:yes stop_codon:yes gene_type:complete